MKRGLGLFVFAVLMINFAFAYDLNVTNVSVKTNYALGEVVSGQFNLNLTNAPVDLYFSSEFGTLSLREFLKSNGKPLTCENINCSDIVTLGNNGDTSKVISLDGVGEKKYALAITDSGSISLNQLILNFSSNFAESTVLPLQIKIANGPTLTYDNFSENYNRQITYGCFNTNLSSYTESLINQNSVGYCEKVSLGRSKKYLLGAQISGSGLRDLELQLKDNSGLVVGKCNMTFGTGSTTQFSGDSHCIVETPSINAEGNYYVCLKDITTGTSSSIESSFYKVRSETTGNNCGYYSTISGNSSIDYAIYAKLPMYSAASAFSFTLNSSNGLSAINSYINSNYGGSCTNTCVIPISINGIAQTLNLNSIVLTHTSSTTGPKTNNKIYETSYSVRKTNFSGELSLDKFNWSLNIFGNKSLTLNLLGDGTKKILNSTINVSSLPVIVSVTPLNPPAGVEVFFFANVRNPGNSTRYEWDFGDGTSKVITNVSYVAHAYQNVSNYNMTIKFGEGNYSATTTFVLSSVNPKNSLNLTFNSKRAKLNHASNDLLALPSWYQSSVSKSIDLDYYQTELNKLESARLVASTDQDYLNVAKGIYDLNMPWAILATEKKTGPLVSDYNYFNPSVVQEIFPSSVENDTNLYRAPIFAWQMENIQATVTKTKLQLLDETEAFKDIILVYDVSVTSTSNEESYFIIQKDFSQVNFNSANAGPKKVGSSTYLIIPAGETITFSFFVTGSVEPTMFISPKLSVLAVSHEIGICNYNARCEKNLGENYKNCRSDCAPVGWTWFWLILFLFFALIVYTILQVWYKRKYEEYLFKDRNEMYNLLTFIGNARMSKLSNNQIKEVLIQKGWDKDQVEYALMRSEGKNPGMFEIIPVDKIISVMEKKKSVSTVVQKPAAPANPYPAKPGVVKPAFNPFSQQRPLPQNNNQLNKQGATGFRQQNDTKY